MNQRDLLLLGGRIYLTADRSARVEAMAIRAGCVLAVGTETQVRSLAGPQSKTIRLSGHSVLPGMIDAHIHLQHYAVGLSQVDCSTTSLEDCLQRLRLRGPSTGPGAWIRGHGWDQNLWGGYGTRQQLDDVLPANPVYLTAKSMHAAWANSRALVQAGIHAATPDPPGGRIERDPSGEPTGILFENAMQLVSNVIEEPSIPELAEQLEGAQAQLWRLGLTGVHDFDGPQCFRALQILRTDGRLGLRVLKNIPVQELTHALAIGLRSGFGDDWIRIGNIKVFADGALGPRTAAMFEPYAGEPQNRGMLLVDHEELAEIGIRAARGGLGLTVHAIGDRANHEVLNALGTVREHEARDPRRPLRHRIEHLQIMHPDDLSRPGKLGITASMQPIHVLSDMSTAERYWGERTRNAYAWRTQLQAGANLAFGSDAPVESPNPFWGVYAAVGRRRLDGKPGPEGWHPEQRLSFVQALGAYTLGPAFAAGTEDCQGQLQPGYWADLIVLPQDPFECGAEALAELRPVGTMVAGEWRYRAF